ncbi:MAG: endopeptidase La [Rhodospirillales bacterium 24-66-33]|jgi:ATP-dependent Lon protease|nr:MAG: endopeptidase La [Rhodospirillales bacterium 35-66-84]OYZ95752.1 MAG: endopeptidase La [Rhodospirillales bacterium 24-66-33]OZB27270.1 MAG: endopeptidase La [Rhodospirillales bacterium 39-66-50]
MSPQDDTMQPVSAKADTMPDSKPETKPLPSDALIVVPVRDLVLFPEMVFPVSVGRPSSVAAIQQAVREQRQILLVLQRDPAKEELVPADLHPVGTVANILRYVTTPDGNHHIVCQGVQRFRITDFVEGHPFLLARGLHLAEPTTDGPEIEARFLVLKQQIRDTLELLPQVPQELRQTVENTTSAGALADLAASYLDSKPNEKQEILEAVELVPRLDKVTQLLSKRLEVLRISSEIGKQTKSSLDARQREMVLREQMAAIQRELGEDDSNKQAIADLDKAITEAKMPPEAETAARKELRRLQRTPEASAEHGMIRTYLDTLVELPWALPETQPIDIAEARRVLDADHFGLEKIKKRIVEYLAVRKLAPEGKAPILCFAGPPGVGKTSLGQSIARAMGRKFARVSLGGVHDEAEIRGHRRTYIGALPGTIIQAIRKAGSRDCVMMLDEIDKMGSGVHGDPSAAMLEVLDPEQNGTFRDNYLDVPFDLSRVVFIATANMLDTIPGPLRDRMEIIQLSGYTAGEKLQIAKRYLVRRQLEANGLTAEQASIDDAALELIIGGYTREAGVRWLEREIGRALRHVAVQVAEGSATKVQIGKTDIEELLGPLRFENDVAMRTSVPGVATGLAWTPVGGDILFIEATRSPGNGKLILTGQLGEVMRESAQAALSVLKNKAKSIGLDAVLFEKNDIHVHVPAGATPKDGPSAGVAMFMALASLMTGRTIRSDTAMTGEISLRGLVLPVGGIKEKVVAAAAAGITRVMLPARNKRDYDDIPEEVRTALEFIWLEQVDDAVAQALTPDAPDESNEG